MCHRTGFLSLLLTLDVKGGHRQYYGSYVEVPLKPLVLTDGAFGGLNGFGLLEAEEPRRSIALALSDSGWNHRWIGRDRGQPATSLWTWEVVLRDQKGPSISGV